MVLGTPEVDTCPVGHEAWRAAHELRSALASTTLPLPLAGSGPLRDLRDRLLERLEDHVLPRLAAPDRPMLVVVGGPTGVGKSTLVNTMLGSVVTPSGLSRPTTRSPVLVHHPADRRWFGGDGILPFLDRVEHPTGNPRDLQVVAADAVPPGVAILDSPDFDSIEENNRRVATRLLAAADMWLFVTSAARYADDVPWRELELAAQRRTPLLLVMNRVPAEDLETVSADFVHQLDRRGVARGEVAFVTSGPVDDGLLPPGRVAPIRRALEELSAAPARRRGTTWRGVLGTVGAAVAATGPLGDAARRQVEAGRELGAIVHHIYAAASSASTSAATDGTLVRAGLRAQWHDLVGPAENVPMIESIRRAREALTALPPSERDGRVTGFQLEIDLALERLLLEHAERAAAAVSTALRGTSYGEAMLAGSAEDLSRPGRRFGLHAQKAIAQWRRGLAAAAVDFGEDDPAATRGIVLGLAVCALGAADAQGVPGLVAAARDGLADLVGDLMAAERDRYLDPMADLPADAPGRLRAAALALESAIERTVHDA